MGFPPMRALLASPPGGWRPRGGPSVAGRRLSHSGTDALDTLWAALALVLVVEGLMPFVAPRAWRETFRRLTEMSDGQIRFIGLISIALGLAAFLVLRHA
jgi:uncharacterized protein